MLNHKQSDRMALTTAKKMKLQLIVFITILWHNKCFFFCGKTMDSNFLQYALKDDIYFILKVVNFQLRNEILLCFDKKGQHSKLRMYMYTQRSRSGI